MRFVLRSHVISSPSTSVPQDRMFPQVPLGGLTAIISHIAERRSLLKLEEVQMWAGGGMAGACEGPRAPLDLDLEH